MNFDEWEPVYEAILEDFGFNRDDDEEARDLLGTLCVPFDLAQLNYVDGATVAIAGGARSLADDLSLVQTADVVIAASTAVDVIQNNGLAVDLMVTDLDKNPETTRDLTQNGIPVAVHAHGDNIPAIRTHVPTFDLTTVLPTTQAVPRSPVMNFGGFTDGDRAAFLADHLGARTLWFPGWDFDDPALSEEKHQKLKWAERLLCWLEHRRNESFEILEDRRNQIDLAPIPL